MKNILIILFFLALGLLNHRAFMGNIHLWQNLVMSILCLSIALFASMRALKGRIL